MSRCKPGDLAMITRDVPSCKENIGRIVRVSGPPGFNRHGQLTWLIQPVTAEPYLVNDALGEFVRFMEFQEPEIEHPDIWMMPIRPDDIDAENKVEDEAHLASPSHAKILS
jgi:hypothetical protein